MIITIGDSFTYGSDLPDENPGYNHSELVWQAQLAKQLGTEYKTYAWPGIGNKEIASRTMQAIHDHGKQHLYIINWTFIDRHDFYPASGPRDRHDPYNGHERYTVRPTDTSKLGKVYYKEFHSTKNDKQTSLQAILATLHALNGAPFIMTYMDHLLLEDHYDMSGDIHYMQQLIKSHLVDFRGQTFLEWSRSNGYAVSDSWHPLEEAHTAAASMMLPLVKTKYQ